MPLKLLQNYIHWYFVFVPQYLVSILFRYIGYIDDKLAITVMASYIFVPLFNDKTVLGYVLGFVFRLIRIIFGGFILLVFIISAFLILVFWVIAPALFLYYGFSYFLLFLVISFSLFLIKRMYLPTQHTHHVKSLEDLENAFTPPAKHIYSVLVRLNNKSKFVSLLLKSKDVRQMLLRLELDYIAVEKMLIDNLQVTQTEFLKSIYKYKDLSHFIRPNLLFLALVESNKNIQLELVKKNISLIDVEDVYKWQILDRSLLHKLHIWDLDYKPHKVGGLNRAWLAKPTPLLDKISEDITKIVLQNKNNFAVFGKDKVIQQLKVILSKQERQNVLIIGKPGVGKSSLIYGLASDIVTGRSNKSLRFKRIVKLDATKLLALNEKKSATLINIIDEIKQEKNTILYIDDIHVLSSLSVANSDKQGLFEYLQPYLENNKLQVIGTTSPQNYKKFIEPNITFSRLFKKLELTEPTDDDVLSIMQFNLLHSEKVYSIQALKQIINLSKKYIKKRVLPDKAISILEILNAKDTDNVIYQEKVNQYFTQLTGVPVNKITIDEAKNLLNLETNLNNIIIAQPKAIQLISDAIIKSRTGTRSKNKLIASFLFAGPTGVGKTYTAKMLAKSLFGQQEMLTRFDMSEFQNLGDTNTFINRLCDAVYHKTYSVILIDEIEKANEKLILTLLQVLDEAKLTNANGEVFDFTQTIIIATTNVGNKVITSLYNQGKSVEEIEPIAMLEIKNHFVPELLNRFSDIVIFSPLNKAEIFKIAKLEIDKLVSSMQVEKNINLIYSDKFVYFVVNNSYSSEYGARPIDRFIEENIQLQIAKLILQGKISSGSSYNLDQFVNTKHITTNE